MSSAVIAHDFFLRVQICLVFLSQETASIGVLDRSQHESCVWFYGDISVVRISVGNESGPSKACDMCAADPTSKMLEQFHIDLAGPLETKAHFKRYLSTRLTPLPEGGHGILASHASEHDPRGCSEKMNFNFQLTPENVNCNYHVVTALVYFI